MFVVSHRCLLICRSLTLLQPRDADFVKFNDRAEEISLMQSRYRQLEMRLESYEKTQAEMEDNARYSFICITLI